LGRTVFRGYLPGLTPGGPRDGILINPLGPNRTGTVAGVTIEVDLPPGVEITGSERQGKRI
jgi:hypothetical protein